MNIGRPNVSQVVVGQGFAVMYATEHDFGTGAAVAPVQFGYDTAQGIQQTMQDPVGAARGIACAATHPGGWYSGVRAAMRSGDPMAIGMEGALAFLNTATVVEGVGGTSALVRRGVMGRSGPRLLPTEGNVGTYRDLIDAGSPGDNITPHHIPSANRMAHEGVSRGDGIAINMEQTVPGVGGRHRATFTYGTRADANIYYGDSLLNPQTGVSSLSPWPASPVSSSPDCRIT